MKFFKNALTPLCAISVLFAAVLQTNAAVVCYDSHATGANDGTSWADAFTDLQAAVTAAGDGGEVHVRQGVHYPVAEADRLTKTVSIGDVKIIGGYTGVGDERSTDRRLTVFSGDYSQNDKYVDQNGEDVGPVFDYEKSEVIDFRAPTEEEKYWRLANYADNLKALFTVPLETVTKNQRIEGITFVGIGNGGTVGGPLYAAGSDLLGATDCIVTITNCDFVAGFAIGSNGSGLIALASESEILDCRFLGCSGCCIIYICCSGDKSGEDLVATVKGCAFQNLYGVWKNLRSTGIVSYARAKNAAGEWVRSAIDVLDCTFDYIYGGDNGGSVGSWHGLVLGTSQGYFRSINNCKFRHILEESKTGTQLCQLTLVNNCIVYGSCTMRDCEISDCTIESEYPVSSMICVNVMSNCVVRNCRNTQTIPGTAGDMALVYANNGNMDVTLVSNRLDCANAKGATLIFGEIRNYGWTRITDNVVSNQGNSVLSSSARRLNGVIVENNVLTSDAGDVILFNANTLCENTAIVDNELHGGAKICQLISSPSGIRFFNSTIARNKLSGYSSEALAAIYYRSGNDSYITWTTFYNNEAPYEIYSYLNTAKGERLQLVSSVIYRDESTENYTPYFAELGPEGAEGNQGIFFVRSYFKGVDTTHPYFTLNKYLSADECYTEAPVFWDRKCRAANGYPYFVMKSSPYKKKPGYAPLKTTTSAVSQAPAGTPIFYSQFNGCYQIATTGFNDKSRTFYNYDAGGGLLGTETACTDMIGNSYDYEKGKVVIGAVQKFAPSGLMLLAR